MEIKRFLNIHSDTIIEVDIKNEILLNFCIKQNYLKEIEEVGQNEYKEEKKIDKVENKIELQYDNDMNKDIKTEEVKKRGRKKKGDDINGK